jgi:hypothetical protein
MNRLAPSPQIAGGFPGIAAALPVTGGLKHERTRKVPESRYD